VNQTVTSLQQFLSDGTADTTFGAGSTATFGNGAGIGEMDLVILSDGATAFAVLETGLSVYKIDDRGALVKSFGIDGRAHYVHDFANGYFRAPLKLMELADKTFFAAYGIESSLNPDGSGPYSKSLVVSRISAEGKLLGQATVLGGTDVWDGWSMVALSDTSVVVARNAFNSSANAYESALYRVLPDSTVDSTFVKDGAGFRLPSVAKVSGMALDANGRLLVTGEASDGNAVIARISQFAEQDDAQVIEFFNTTLGHFFMTSNPKEASAIDAGAAGPGWQRTGLGFRSGGSTLVCRFYGNSNLNPAIGTIYGPNSHFYTADASECGGLRSSFNPSAKSWKFESYDFATTIPNFSASDQTTCPTGTQPVFRAYNDGFARGVDSNHRFTTDFTAYQQTVAMGWIGEGVAMCAPR